MIKIKQMVVLVLWSRHASRAVAAGEEGKRGEGGGEVKGGHKPL